MGKRIENYTKGGICSNCGQCCSNFLPMDHQEIDRIRRYIKKHNITAVPVSVPYSDRFSLILHCPFRDDSQKRCLIYPVRPGICKSFQCDKEESVIFAERSKAHLKSGGYEVDMRATFCNERPAFEYPLTSFIP